jgi:hypothetical protein
MNINRLNGNIDRYFKTNENSSANFQFKMTGFLNIPSLLPFLTK